MHSSFVPFRISINSRHESFEVSQSGFKVSGGEHVFVKVNSDVVQMSSGGAQLPIERRNCRFAHETEVRKPKSIFKLLLKDVFLERSVQAVQALLQTSLRV